MNRAERRARTAQVTREIVPANSKLNRFLLRQHDLSTVHARLVMPLRLYRETLAAAEGTAQHWTEIAGIINVAGMFAKLHNRLDWINELMPGADALRSVQARNDRVGGRWVAVGDEVAEITRAINVIDFEILHAMAAIDFVEIAKAVNDIQDEYAKEAA